MHVITRIGKCIGCLKMGKLEGQVGKCCLDDPNRGRDWAYSAHRVRTDFQFAREVMQKLKTQEGKRLFIEMFGEDWYLKASK